MPASYRTSEPPIYTFRVRILDCWAGFAPPDCREIQREIEIAANHTLADLADMICTAYGFDDPHLWSFFLSGKRWDTASQYTIDTDALLPGFASDALVQMLDRFPLPPDATLDENFTQLREFVGEFVPSFPRETRDRMREYLSLPPSDAPPDSAADIDDELVGAFLDGFDPEFLMVIEMMLANAPSEQRPEIRAGLADALRSDILGTLDDAEGVIVLPPALDPALSALTSLFPALPPDLFPDEDPLAGDAEDTRIRDVPYPGKTGKREFLFLFDYGDQWEFGVKLLNISPTKTPRARYPRVTARRGKSPHQYPPASWYDDEGYGPRITIGILRDPTTGALTQQIIEIPAPPPPPPRKRAKAQPEPDAQP